MLTAAAQIVGASPRATYGLVRRLWTDESFRTVRESDTKLDLWHVPAEKTRGLARLFRAFATDPEILDMQAGAEWRLFLAEILGVSAAPGEGRVVTGGRLRMLRRRFVGRASDR